MSARHGAKLDLYVSTQQIQQAGRLVPFAVLIGFIAGLTLDAVFRRLAGVNVITDDMLKTLSERGTPAPPGRA